MLAVLSTNAQFPVHLVAEALCSAHIQLISCPYSKCHSTLTRRWCPRIYNQATSVPPLRSSAKQLQMNGLGYTQVWQSARPGTLLSLHDNEMPTSFHPNKDCVPVIDLFAGPGGLGEGFSAVAHDRLWFDVVLSVEKDAAAHQTLLTRAFFRQLQNDDERARYYSYLRGDMSRDELFRALPAAAAAATARCLHLELAPRTTQRVYADMDRLVAGKKRWVLVGGPPCQAYSVVGRSRLTKMKREEFEKNAKHVLYREYLRILARYRPPLFVMENVKGLLSATYGGHSTFERMISDLSSPTLAVRESINDKMTLSRRGSEYAILSLVHTTDGSLRPEDYVIPAERYGVPQKRHRVILLGVRSDLKIPPELELQPSDAPEVRDVLADLPVLRSQLSREHDDAAAWVQALTREMLFFRQASVSDHIFAVMRTALKCLPRATSSGGRWVAKNGCSLPATTLTEWLLDPLMRFVVNHETRRHIPEDLLRYLFAAAYATVNGRSPKLHEFPRDLLPNHQNVAHTLEQRHGFFNDRFRVQVADQPATTVTSHISKDGHYFIHHDPKQCRSWTVREAARVQTFPDNYFFEGTRTDQFRQVGNAVPPYLAVQVARAVARILASQE